MYGSTYYQGGVQGTQDGSYDGRIVRIDTSREHPTDTEFRPINTAVRWLIKAE